MKRAFGLWLCTCLSAIPLAAQARDTVLNLSAAAASSTEAADKQLTRIAFFLKGQGHRPVKHELGEWSVHGRVQAVLRTDEQACEAAFISALAALQKRAEQEGGNAIVRIESITRREETSSATDYRCVVGATVAHVGLRGDVVMLDQ
jgi:hypothetical protein